MGIAMKNILKIELRADENNFIPPGGGTVPDFGLGHGIKISTTIISYTDFSEM